MSHATAESRPLFCNFHFKSNIDVASPVRRFVSEIVDRLLRRPEVASRLEVAVHELVENSLKYSLGEGARIEIEVYDAAEKTRIVVRTTNRASPEYAAIVDRLVREMHEAAGDPIQYYLNALERTSATRLGSGLGLARVFAESGMQVSSSRPNAEELCVSAELTIDP